MKLFTAFHVGSLDTHGPLPEVFNREFRAAVLHGQTSFEYGGTTFTIEPGPSHGFIYAMFSGIPTYTPAAFFHGGIPLGEIHLTALEPPMMLQAKPGWYYRDEDVGQASTWVHVDPNGDNWLNVPVVTARGRQLDSLVAFFNEVMAGKLEPQLMP